VSRDDAQGRPWNIEATLHIVRAAQGGDARAVDELFTRYLPRTRRIVACRMGCRLRDLEDQEDLVQGALLRVFESLDSFEPTSEASFRHWLARLVENTIRNAARDAARLKRGAGKVRRVSELATDSLAALTLPGRAPTASAVLRGAELEARIETALLALPKRYREAIVLRSLCGMSYAEVREALGVEREATARQICARALAKLREELDA